MVNFYKKLLTFLLLIAFSKSFAQNQHTISGKIIYDNSKNTGIKISKLYIKDSLNTNISSTYTDTSGSYSFKKIPNGRYTIQVIPNYKNESASPLHALLVNRSFIGVYNFKDALMKKSADVNKDGKITPLDALLINKRYIHIVSSFKAGDWQIIDNSVTVAVQDVTQDIKIIGTGDVNGSFTPEFSFSCGDTLVDAINDQSYTTVQIGNQCWMQQNLASVKFNDGTTITNVTADTAWASLTSPARCWYNNDSLSNAGTYGALYNWFAVSTAKLCPTGWHVPSYAEWDTLVTYLGGSSVAGAAMKESGTAHWQSPNAGATNSSGFTALPAGYLDALYGSFYYLGQLGYWWSATYSGDSYAWQCSVYYNDSKAYLNGNYGNSAFSVRCLKNN